MADETVVMYQHFLVKESMMAKLAAWIDEKGWRQREAAQFLDVSQSRISDLLAGKDSAFSVDVLMKWLLRAGFRVSLTFSDDVQPSGEGGGFVDIVSKDTYERSLEYVRKQIAVNPADAHSYSRMGCVLDRLQRFDEAIAAYTKSLELLPDCTSTLWGRSLSYAACGQLKLALLDCERWIQLDSNAAEAYEQRAEIYCRLDRLDDALSDYDHALALRPDNSIYLAARASIYERLGSMKLALADLKACVALGCEDPYVLERCERLSKS